MSFWDGRDASTTRQSLTGPFSCAWILYRSTSPWPFFIAACFIWLLPDWFEGHQDIRSTQNVAGQEQLG